MRKIILASLLFVIFLAFGLDVGFIDSILVGQTRIYRVGESNLSVKLLNIYEEGAAGETKIILELNGEETNLLGEDEEDVLLDGKLIIRVYDIFPTQKKVKFQIQYSDVEESNKTEDDKNETVVGEEKKEDLNVRNETKIEEFVDENQSVWDVNAETQKENISDLVLNEKGVEWRRVELEETEKKENIFLRIWKWFISLFSL